MENRCYNEAMNKPTLIGLLIGLAVCLTGCAKRSPDSLDLTYQGSSDDFVETPLHQVSSPIRTPEVFTLPIDDAAKRLGKKAFARVSASLRRSPRDDAPEDYRVGAGTTLYLSPTDDRRWMQVRLSEGRNAFIRTDETSAALALAQAQGRLADQQRLAPSAKPDQQVDAGDGKSGGPRDRDPALDGAILELQEAFADVDDAWDRFRAETTGFQSQTADWPTVRDSALQLLNVLAGTVSNFDDELRSVTALSSNMTANERAAYQAIVLHLGETHDSITSCQQTLNQMANEEPDWPILIETLQNNVQSLAGAIDGLRVNLAKLG